MSARSWVQGAVSVLLVTDVYSRCPQHTGWLHYVEALLALLAGLSAAYHALRRRPAPLTRRPPISPVVPHAAAAPVSPGPRDLLCAAPRGWSPTMDPGPPVPSEPRTACPRDPFISDEAALAEYVRQAEALAEAASPAAIYDTLSSSLHSPHSPHSPPHHYQVSAAEGGETRGDPAPAEGGVGRVLHVSPARLMEGARALRLWLLLTVLRPLAGRLEQAGSGPPPPELRPYLCWDGAPDYVAARVRELSASHLAAYRWARGGAGWRAGLPRDADLLVRLTAAYLDSQLPGGFSARHLSAAPARPARPSTRALLHRASPPAAAPHYVVLCGRDVLQPPPGRHNADLALLLLLSQAAARGELHRAALSPAGLNLLWVLDL